MSGAALFADISGFTPSTEALSRALGPRRGVEELLSKRGAYADAWNWLEQSRSLFHELREEAGVAEALHFSGSVGAQQGDYDKARERYHWSLAINRELGDQWSIANSLSSLGDVALSQKDYDAALAFLEESLAINQELSDRRAIAFLFEFFAELAAAKNQPRRVLRLAGVASALRDAIGAPLSPAEQIRLNHTLVSACATRKDTERSALLNEGNRMVLEQAVDYALEATSE